MYEANNIHKGIFIKNLLDFSDDYSRSVAKNQFWYLDEDATTVTDGNATNKGGIRSRALLSQGGLTVETIIPLNRYSFFESFPTGYYRRYNLSLKLNCKTIKK